MAVALSFVPYAHAAGNKIYLSRKAMRVIEQKLVAAARLSSSAPNGLKTVKAKWEVVRTKTFHRRQVSVTTPWGRPKTVETSCRGIEKDNKIYVASSCYYPVQKQNQEIKWLGSQLIDNQKNINLKTPDLITSDWVAFELPERLAD